ncbi:single-stranded DNA-binding protein [Enterococcus gilvus]|uniref:Single-stranded DNA-binding protein n=1 Tax=Enterococcus gilvus ATCC BAA-350 TaxID=1158614 RepID=R2V1X2_9ENTE|nr:single-stranded DNA-binding protein [Enterococcus gilvus]EOI51855.1 single-stranded DNA-binding protein [Enterococcus gilvus ATCC BAA-350]EOW78415.1 single-stranded DNA-binding protein [Enterococcus gilvus ATCC BAA-350]OJG37833.1 single-stranded DNA-binding protein [Enterococcus gilvus]
MINNVVLVGRLTKDPDLRYTQQGKAVATYTLAVNRKFTNQAGNKEADFINCVIWGKRAEALANYCRKGALIGTTGRIQTRNYDNQQGQRVYITEVVAEDFQMLESRSVSESRDTKHKETSHNSTQHQENLPEDPDLNGQDVSNTDIPYYGE